MGVTRIEDYDRIIMNPDDFAGDHCIAQGSLPRPELDVEGSWWQEKYAQAEYVPSTGGQISLGPIGSAPGIYRTDPRIQVSDRWWSASLSGAECTVNVRGTSIWMFPEGLRCEAQLRFHRVGPEKATVILVGRPGAVTDGDGSLEEDVGIALLGGVYFEPNVSVFLISSGCVEIEHHLGSVTDDGYAKYLSIYADWVKLMGPENPLGGNADMTLEHGACNVLADQDEKDGLVDQLIEANLLPNSRFARRKLAFVPGTWNENPTPVEN